MTGLLTTGDIFIWVTSVAAGVVLCAGAYRFMVVKSASSQAKAILGEWIGYAYFHSVEGEHFYKEVITVTRHLILPWRFRLKAVPQEGSGATVYRGSMRYHGGFFYCTAYEPVFDDRVFEISRLIMDREHNGSMIVALAMGMTYDERVHCSTAHVWSRKSLDSRASRTRPADLAAEEDRFREIVKTYFSVSSDTYQLKML
jgi:hypothetical protein